MKKFFPIPLVLTFLVLSFIPGCTKDSDGDGVTDIEEFFLGLTGDDDLDTVPTTPNFNNGSGTLPSAVDLTPKFPPVGDQGRYGTCVAWAVAYNIKTAVNGISKGYSTSQLTSAANQFSPKYLFTAIDDDKKGNNCNGTNFNSALDALQNRGVATMQSVPYTSLGNCSQSSLQSSWNNEAQNYKIKYWRKIDPSVASIKQNIANNVPVLLGAKLSDNFMTWNSDNVITSNTTYNTVGIHAYHALVIAGYDDNRGPGGAFKIINTWGTSWGNYGYCWMDYNFLVNEFCINDNSSKNLYIVANDDGNAPPVDPVPNLNGVDLATWAFSDYSTYQTSGIPTQRQLTYNVYNVGGQAAQSSANWGLYYIYYNAYDANDYGVIFYDEFTNSIPANTYDCPSDNYCAVNFSIPSGGDFATTAFGTSSLYQTYNMPTNVSGYYYLMLYADGLDVFAEQDEQNNLFYTSEDPKLFTNGYSQFSEVQGDSASFRRYRFENKIKPSIALLRKSQFNTIVTPKFKNAYTPGEIIKFFKNESKTGRLRQKVKATGLTPGNKVLSK